MKSINIGWLSAMPEEIGNTIENLNNLTLKEYGNLKFVLPPLKKAKLKSDTFLNNWIYNSLSRSVKNGNLNRFGLIKKGLIATGDSFISEESEIKRLIEELPNLEAIEMEGGAVAQVAEQEGIPWVVVRVISDSADLIQKRF